MLCLMSHSVEKGQVTTLKKTKWTKISICVPHTTAKNSKEWDKNLSKDTTMKNSNWIEDYTYYFKNIFAMWTFLFLMNKTSN